MNKFFALAALVVAAGSVNAAVITQWNFNSNPADTSTATGSLLPSLGAGSISTIGGVTSNFASGAGSSDPATVDDSGYNSTNYQANPTTGPVVSVENRGVRVDVSTLTFQDIVLNFDWRTSNTGSDLLRVDYTTDAGATWVLGTTIFDSAGGDTWNNNLTVDLTGVAAANNNAGFGVRFVAVVDAGTGRYRAANVGSNHAATGTWRFDLVTVNGTIIPGPGAIALAGIAGLVATRRRRA
jgi:hypothetical protein